jgi:S1-C subfamily serine protease
MRLPVQVLRNAAFFFAAVFGYAQTESPIPSGEMVIERVGPSVVVVIARTPGDKTVYATGLVGRADGILFTAYHAVKDAREVQVRLKTGEIFDRVELLGFDARRDVAALRISATGLPPLPLVGIADIQSGQSVFVLSHAAGLTWTASSGIVSGIRMADEVPGAGSGYRIVQFTALVSPGSSGGVVVDGRPGARPGPGGGVAERRAEPEFCGAAGKRRWPGEHDRRGCVCVWLRLAASR